MQITPLLSPLTLFFGLAQSSSPPLIPQAPLHDIGIPTTTTTTMTSSQDVLSQLDVSMEQVSKSPPTIGIKVTNTGAQEVTVLTWESPLDSLALALGLVTLTPAGGNQDAKPLEIPTIKVQRKLPPGDDALVSLAPGESRENRITLKEPLVSPEELKGKGSLKVGLKGRWTRVWPTAKGDLTRDMIEQFGVESAGASGEYDAGSIEIQI